MSKINNPLKRRVPRELLGEWHKYVVIALFLIIMIGFISGIYVANNSMLKSVAVNTVNCNLEDGCFEVSDRLDTETIAAIESGEKADVKQYYFDKAHEEVDKEVEKTFGDFVNNSDYADAIEEAKKEAYSEVDKKVNEEYDKAAEKYDLDNPDYKAVQIKVYENFYKDVTETRNNGTGKIRIFKDRTDIDLYSIHEGNMPVRDDEIAIDRMHADNVNIKIGDTINVGGKDFKVTALIALVNYSTLYEKPTDSMFDATYFDVAIVTDEGFDRIDKNLHYNYSWKYIDEPADEIHEKDLSENVMAVLISHAAVNDLDIENYLPNYSNEAIHFATADLGRDKSMAGILLYILVAVLAFVFAITISNTINKEASVIGTLRASGYTRNELLIHYMTMPVFVTLFSAIIGNVLGYTFFKNIAIGMYYNSYSLPTYETYWASEAFVKTTVIPVVMMFVINFAVISRMLRFSPLKFLKHDLKISKRKKAIRLPKWSFLKRFRTRILFQNIPNYLVLFLGIAFVMLMMAMAVGFPDSLDVYQDNVADMMFVKYQTILKTTEDEDDNPIETTTKSAEKFAMNGLQYEAKDHNESIAVYGVEDNSAYIKDLAKMAEKEVYISNSFADKFGISVGDDLRLDEKYDNEFYELKVVGIYDYSGSLSVFMPIDNYRSIFNNDDDYFTGYMADEEIEGIDDKYIATTITKDDVLKISRQLDHSMGSYMTYFQYVCLILSVVLIYLLTKIVIEKNENAISMVKILGYENREISSLYMTSTTIVVIVSCVVGILLGYFGMEGLFRRYLMTMEGWFSFVITPVGIVKMFMFVFIAYLIVMVFDYNRIKRIPMDRALKNVE
ncbi:MAG: ABC transporter permease [Eubacterium sp.]|nr:ABC transporter permease [Eubacterium sp.]